MALSAEDFRRSPFRTPVVARGGGMFKLRANSEDSFKLAFEGRSREEVRPLTALDKEGKPLAVSVRNSEWSISGAGLDDLGGLQWERRKDDYPVGVKFRNISLLKSQKSEMVIEVDEAGYVRNEKMSISYYNMSIIGMALINYLEDHNGLLPEGISAEHIRPYFEDDNDGKLFDWVQQNVQFLDRGVNVKNMTIGEIQNTPVAYDKVLLQEIDYTVVTVAGGYRHGVMRIELGRYGIVPVKKGEPKQLSSAEDIGRNCLILCSHSSRQALRSVKEYFSTNGITTVIGRFGGSFVIYCEEGADRPSSSEAVGFRGRMIEVGRSYVRETQSGDGTIKPEAFESSYWVVRDRIERDERHLESVEKLRMLNSAILTYADDFDQALPGNIADRVFQGHFLGSFGGFEIYDWWINNVEYVLKEKNMRDVLHVVLSPLAYDRGLLAKDVGT